MHPTKIQYGERPKKQSRRYIYLDKEKNPIKHSHLKEEMRNRLDLLKAGAYYTAVCFQPITAFSPDHCICYCYQDTLPLTDFSIVTTQFSALTKTISVQKYCQLSLLVDDDSTP